MKRIAAVATLLALSGVLLGQQPAPSKPPAYRLKPGDRIQVRVFGQPELSAEFPVPPHGAVSYPLLGTLPVAGRSVEEVERDISGRLVGRKILTEPSVSVLVQEYSTRSVFILGEVRRADEYQIPLDGELRLANLVSMAGGFTEDADMSRVEVNRYEGNTRRTIPVDFSGTGARAEAGIYMRMEAGDQVVVRELASAFVLGQVSAPGEVRVPTEGLGILQVLAMAGLKDYEAATDKVRVIRPGRSPFVVDVSALLESERSVAEPTILPRDTVYVPRGGFMR